jgi:cellulose synthase/poly-beta-1,6-N-acetylglucosamine synthase-like glycosyltransferase
VNEIIENEVIKFPPSRDDQRLGQLLLNAGTISEKDLDDALNEQANSGGKLGDILVANGVVDRATVTDALASKLASVLKMRYLKKNEKGEPVLPTVQAREEPRPLLAAHQARGWRAVVLSDVERAKAERPLPVAFEDPTLEVVKAVEEILQQPVQPKLADQETLTGLVSAAYSEEDAAEITTTLYEREPRFSAYRIKLSPHQYFIGAMLIVFLVFVTLIASAFHTILVGVALATSMVYLGYSYYRLHTAYIGWQTVGSTAYPSTEDTQSLCERELPVYTILLPIYKEKRSTVDALFKALSRLDYPKHKIDGLLLLEADDKQTQETIEEVGKPEWLKILHVPPGGPRTKPKAMQHGLLYARGSFLTIYDAEDAPDPHQLKKAVWIYQRVDNSVACLQAKLNYYNPRQNLLTRWFTLEYESWFDLFLPGLHQIGAPIPLGGTSNHFRTAALREVLGWDPYNVTEDADLGLRLHRMGKRTLVLESTTYEEANSKFLNWMRQRSRWVKGYMQTFLVHTRNPLALYREIGLRNSLIFVATFGGYIAVVLMNPIFWGLVLLWFLAYPGWLEAMFPGAVYYLALVSLWLGNFFFILLGLMAALGRGQDDLGPYTLLAPLYWLLMSVAAYVALYELIFSPHHWWKTEHGLHFEEEAVQGGEIRV